MKSKLEKQYEQNVQAYKSMGLEIPVDLETVTSKLTKHQKAALSKGTGQLVISPAINDKFTFKDLLEKVGNYWFWDELWDQYELSGLASIGVINIEGDNQYGDLVTQHTNKTIEEQRNVKGGFISPVEAVVLEAIFRLDGNHLAPKTFIRFPQLPNKTLDGDSYVGYVYSGGGQLRFDGSDGHAGPVEGVGLSVGKKIPLSSQSSVLPDSFSSEAEAIDLLKEAGYTITKEF